MKIHSATLITLLITTLIACSDENPKETNQGYSQSATNNSEKITANNKILEPTGDIKETVLNELQEGRWELVMFWATYCHICKRDFERLDAFIKDNSEIPLTVVGVVVDGDEAKDKAIMQINERRLDYTHIIADFDRSNELYASITETALTGVPSQLLYNTDNDLEGFSRNAIDLDTLEVIVYN